MSDLHTPWTFREFGNATHIRNAKGQFIGSMLAHGKLVVALPEMVEREKVLAAALREARSYIAVAHTPTDLVARIDALLAEIARTPDIAAAFRAETESAEGGGG